MKILIMLMLLILNDYGISHAQITKKVIFELEEILFSGSNEKIYLYEFLECKNQNLDSTILVRTVQPNAENAIDCIHKLLLINPVNYTSRIKAIYSKQILLFDKEFGSLYKRTSNVCKSVGDQFRILVAFEELVYALTIKSGKLNDIELFEEYKKYHENITNFFLNVNERAIIAKRFKTFSPIFKELSTNKWQKYAVTFCWYDPFLPRLKEQLIEFVNDFKWSTASRIDKYFVLQNEDIFYKIDDERMVRYFLKNYNDWSQESRAVIIYRYCKYNNAPELTKYLTSQLIKDPRLRYIYDPREMYLETLLQNVNFKAIIENELIDQITESNIDDDPLVYSFLKYFDDERVADLLIQKSQNLILNQVSLEAIENAAFLYSKNPNISTSANSKISELLKNLKKQ